MPAIITAATVRSLLDKGVRALNEATRQLELCDSETERQHWFGIRRALRAQVSSLRNAAYDEMRAEDPAHGALLLSRRLPDAEFVTGRVGMAYASLSGTLERQTGPKHESKTA